MDIKGLNGWQFVATFTKGYLLHLQDLVFLASRHVNHGSQTRMPQSRGEGSRRLLLTSTGCVIFMKGMAFQLLMIQEAMEELKAFVNMVIPHAQC